MAQKGVFKERLLQVISVAAQVAISRRVQRSKLSLHGRQQEENRTSVEHINTNEGVGVLMHCRTKSVFKH